LPVLAGPSASAAPIIARAGRSLMEPDGLALSSFRNSRHGPRSNCVTSMSGVSPMRSSTEAVKRDTRFHCLNSIPTLLPYRIRQRATTGALLTSYDLLFTAHPVIWEPPQFADERYLTKFALNRASSL